MKKTLRKKSASIETFCFVITENNLRWKEENHYYYFGTVSSLKKSGFFRLAERSILYGTQVFIIVWTKAACEPYPKPVESCSIYASCFCKTHFNIVLPSTLVSQVVIIAIHVPCQLYCSWYIHVFQETEPSP